MDRRNKIYERTAGIHWFLFTELKICWKTSLYQNTANCINTGCNILTSLLSTHFPKFDSRNNYQNTENACQVHASSDLNGVRVFALF